jgi:hypothetical protein
MKLLLSVSFLILRSVKAEERVCEAELDQQECRAVTSPPSSWEIAPGKFCDLDPLSLRDDLDRYPAIGEQDVDRAEQHFGTHARRYVVKDGKLYGRDCAPRAIVGVAAFVEDMLLLLLRKVKVPDVDFVLNCSDYPVNPKCGDKDAPVVSMCGSTLHRDIIVPTYTLAQAVSGRIRVDQAAALPWEKRKNLLVWRGTDSNRDRFKFNLIANSQEFEGLTDVGINKMVRVKHDPAIHGPVKPGMPQRKFGDYKWIANIDGAVAAYRMPAVAALGSTIVKQDSHYLEHWYRKFEPWKHYVPMRKDFSDLAYVLQWLQTHDAEAKKIGESGRQFALANLTPDSILCFWYSFLLVYAARMTYEPEILEGMTEAIGWKW